jgi:hypothetical protein
MMIAEIAPFVIAIVAMICGMMMAIAAIAARRMVGKSDGRVTRIGIAVAIGLATMIVVVVLARGNG